MRGILSFFLLMLPSAAQSNDSAIVGVGGDFHPLKGEHKDIQMVRESVRIDVWNTKLYQTTVDFEFYNHGAAQTVDMGFPESGAGDINTSAYKTKSAFSRFATWIDGRRATVKRMPASDSELTYRALWVKKVHFGAKQKRRIRVRYDADTGVMASPVKDGGMHFVSYHFTGGNWRANVRQSTLTVQLHQPTARVVDIYRVSKQKPANIRRNTRWARLHWTNWPAEAYFDLTFLVPHQKSEM
jgi:hypothetical protein